MNKSYESLKVKGCKNFFHKIFILMHFSKYSIISTFFLFQLQRINLSYIGQNHQYDNDFKKALSKLHRFLTASLINPEPFFPLYIVIIQISTTCPNVISQKPIDNFLFCLKRAIQEKDLNISLFDLLGIKKDISSKQTTKFNFLQRLKNVEEHFVNNNIISTEESIHKCRTPYKPDSTMPLKKKRKIICENENKIIIINDKLNIISNHVNELKGLQPILLDSDIIKKVKCIIENLSTLN